MILSVFAAAATLAFMVLVGVTIGRLLSTNVTYRSMSDALLDSTAAIALLVTILYAARAWLARQSLNAAIGLMTAVFVVCFFFAARTSPPIGSGAPLVFMLTSMAIGAMLAFPVDWFRQR